MIYALCLSLSANIVLWYFLSKTTFQLFDVRGQADRLDHALQKLMAANDQSTAAFDKTLEAKNEVITTSKELIAAYEVLISQITEAKKKP